MTTTSLESIEMGSGARTQHDGGRVVHGDSRPKPLGHNFTSSCMSCYLGNKHSKKIFVGQTKKGSCDVVEGTYHPIHHGQIFDQEDTLKECKMMGAMYVQAVVDSLNERFHDLLVFNKSKLFNPKYDPKKSQAA